MKYEKKLQRIDIANLLIHKKALESRLKYIYIFSYNLNTNLHLTVRYLQSFFGGIHLCLLYAVTDSASETFALEIYGNCIHPGVGWTFALNNPKKHLVSEVLKDCLLKTE